jgi:hypothetical protein
MSSDDRGCRYRKRLDDGGVLMCAIGCHIPDNVYLPAMENRNVHFLVEEYPGVSAIFAEIEWALLGAMQVVHDENDASLWESGFKNVARIFRLTYTLPTGGQS